MGYFLNQWCIEPPATFSDIVSNKKTPPINVNISAHYNSSHPKKKPAITTLHLSWHCEKTAQRSWKANFTRILTGGSSRSKLKSSWAVAQRTFQCLCRTEHFSSHTSEANIFQQFLFKNKIIPCVYCLHTTNWKSEEIRDNWTMWERQNWIISSCFFVRCAATAKNSKEKKNPEGSTK